MVTDRFLYFSTLCESIIKNIRKLENTHMKEYGLRSVHISCLLVMRSEKDGVTMSELTERCSVDKALISRIMNDLYGSGFITCEGEVRKYKAKYLLTEKADRILRELEEKIERYVLGTSGSIMHTDLALFYAVLEKINFNISKLCKETGEAEA